MPSPTAKAPSSTPGPTIETARTAGFPRRARIPLTRNPASGSATASQIHWVGIISPAAG
jgi:hypothetical protein